MNFLNTTLKTKNEAGVRPVDRILEGIAVCLAVVLLMCTLAFYLTSPETVATHFNAAGEANGWGSRAFYWVVCAIGLFVMALCATAAYYPSLINLPVKLRPEALPRQHQLMGEMMRAVNVVLGVMFILVECLMKYTAPEASAPALLHVAFSLIFTVLIGLCLIYTWRIYRA